MSIGAVGPLLRDTHTAVVGDDCVGAVTVENADEPVGAARRRWTGSTPRSCDARRVAAGHPASPDEAIGLVGVQTSIRATAPLDVLVLALVWTDHPRAEEFSST